MLYRKLKERLKGWPTFGLFLSVADIGAKERASPENSATPQSLTHLSAHPPRLQSLDKSFLPFVTADSPHSQRNSTLYERACVRDDSTELCSAGKQAVIPRSDRAATGYGVQRKFPIN